LKFLQFHNKLCRSYTRQEYRNWDSRNCDLYPKVMDESSMDWFLHISLHWCSCTLPYIPTLGHLDFLFKLMWILYKQQTVEWLMLH